MPRVFTKKAAKDYPEHGIKKGDTYYSWSFRYGGSFKSLTYPRPSQLTQSKMSGAYAAAESLSDGIHESVSPDDLVSLIESTVDDIRAVAEEYRDAKEAMLEGLQESPVAQDCEEKADELESWADELESVMSEIGDFGSSDIVSLLDLTEAPKDEDGSPMFKLESVTFDDLNEEQQAEVMSHLIDMVSDHVDCPI